MKLSFPVVYTFTLIIIIVCGLTEQTLLVGDTASSQSDRTLLVVAIVVAVVVPVVVAVIVVVIVVVLIRRGRRRSVKITIISLYIT